MDEDRSYKLNVRMFTKSAKMAEARALECIEKRSHGEAVAWLSLAKECRWAATGEDEFFSLPRGPKS